MKRKVVYLAGPIAGCTDDECKSWREYVKTKLSDHVDILDPMSRDYRGKEDECVKEIVEGDKEDIESSHFLIVNYPYPSAGTCMETLFAWERYSYIILVVPKNGGKISPWMKYHSQFIATTFDEASAHLISKL
jgi:hypothetical protein